MRKCIRHIFLILYLAIIPEVSGYAQQGFNQVYTFNGGSDAFLDVLPDDSFTYVSCVMFDTVSSNRVVHALIKINITGDVVDTIYRRLDWNYVLSKKNMVRSYDGRIYATGNLDSAFTIVLYCYADDTVSWERRYVDTTTNNPFFSVALLSAKTDSMLYLLCNTQADNYDVNTMLIKLDPNGQEVWRRSYGTWDWDEMPNCIEELSDGTLMIGSTKSNVGHITWGMDELFLTWFVRVDTSGAVLDTWVDDASLNAWIPGQVKEVQGGGYVYCGGWVEQWTAAGDAYIRNYIARMDDSYNKLWELQLANNANNVQMLEDLVIHKNIIYASGNEGDTATNQVYGVLHAISLEGEILYTRYYSTPSPLKEISWNQFLYLYKIEIPNDTTILIAGQIQAGVPPGYPTQYGWLIKTDLYGCFTDTCAPDIGPLPKPYQPPVAEAILYPNPSTEWVQLVIPENQLGSTFTIANARGQIIQRGTLVSPVTVFDVQGYAAGIYFLRISNTYGCENLKFIMN